MQPRRESSTGSGLIPPPDQETAWIARPSQVKPPARHAGPIWAVLVLLLGCAAAVFLGYRTEADLHAAERARAQRLADRVVVEIQERFLRATDTLHATRALFAASISVDRLEFRAFVQGLGVGKRLQGIHGVSCIRPVPRTGLEAFLARERADHAPDFQVITSGDHAELFVITNIEPLETNRRAWGFDAGVDLDRRNTMLAAISTGDAVVSPRIQLIQDDRKRAGCVIVLPIFSNNVPMPRDAVARRQSVQGLVSVVLVLEELLADLEATTLGGVACRLREPADAVPWYGASAAPGERDLVSRDLIVAGRSLIIDTWPVGALDLRPARITTAAGCALSLLLAWITWLVVAGRHRTARFTWRVTSDLRAAKEAAEAAMRDNAALLSTLDQHAIVSLTDAQGRITGVNDAFVHLSGYSRGELIGQDHRLINSGMHPKAFWGAIWGELLAGRSWRGEICNRAKDGRLFWLDSILVPFHGSGGTLEKFIAIRTDITARKLVEQRLRESETLLERAGAIAGVGGWYIDLATMIPVWTDQTCRIHDLPAGHRPSLPEAIGYYDPEARAVIQGAVERGMADGTPWDLELPMTTARGRRIWVRAAGQCERLDGRPVRLLGAIQDITARRKADGDLTSAMLMFSNVIDAATTVAIIATRPDGVIVIFNRGAEQMLGYTPGEVVGAQTPALIHDPAEVDARAAALTRELGRPIRGFGAFTALPLRDGQEQREWTYVHRDGRRFTVMLTVTVLRDGQGEVNGFLGLAHDVTARREEARNLERARVAAEAASTAKSTFLANMSHEIRTPMNGILGMTGLLLDTPLSVEQRHLADTVRSCADSLLLIINDVLDFSKIEAGRMQLAPRDFHLGRLLDELHALFAPRAREKNLVWRVERARDLPCDLHGDDGRLRQVLINLVGNALKFTESGEVRLVVDGAAAGDQIELRCAVHDTGIGIPADKLPHLFQAFSQVDASTSRRFGGTGLGLAISRQLVSLMGSELTATSTAGAGSVFRFTVRLARGLPQERTTRVISAAVPRIAPDAPPRILVAEDILVNQQVAVGILRKLGHRADVVADGAAALTAMSTRRYDLVLMDMQMPIMDGVEATRRIRAGEQGVDPATPIVALTANATTDDQAACRAAGMDGYLSKPITLPALATALKTWLRRPPE
jgi:PAS domain S-box-containing protein